MQQYPNPQAAYGARPAYSDAAMYGQQRPMGGYVQPMYAAQPQYAYPQQQYGQYGQAGDLMQGGQYQGGRGLYGNGGGRGMMYGGRGGYRGGRGGFRGRKKRPFVGGSLETQKEFERRTACCFFLQGNCKFGDDCRFLHEGASGKPCQFGDKCRVHSKTAEQAETQEAPAEEKKE